MAIFEYFAVANVTINMYVCVCVAIKYTKIVDKDNMYINICSYLSWINNCNLKKLIYCAIYFEEKNAEYDYRILRIIKLFSNYSKADKRLQVMYSYSCDMTKKKKKKGNL
ncbi:hypothetical protein RFI_30918 [Reticulomyxa filosa]|uniref:Uncharacterized protein n=1 Tax=Reticulomyxa filosa TaxID=46433 RepID=X6LXZ4_RETFI|nr:hypothetical protein RFI_30918 [Reticulomyxa filosa]|eukprot:ETO06474.1 hypothetical protein RFI_30918 [Reticulomyxa filosa]